MAFLRMTADNFYPAMINLEAVPGTYARGQLCLVNASGKIAAISSASTTTPAYLCEDGVVVPANPASGELGIVAGNVLAVTRISDADTFETTLAVAIPGLVVGQKLSVAAGGLQAASAAGTFEVERFEGTAAGSKVVGRFKN